MEKETTKATPVPAQRTAEATRWAIFNKDGQEINALEIPGFDIKVNSETLKNPNVIRAIQNFEARKNRKIIGVRIKQV